MYLIAIDVVWLGVNFFHVQVVDWELGVQLHLLDSGGVVIDIDLDLVPFLVILNGIINPDDVHDAGYGLAQLGYRFSHYAGRLLCNLRQQYLDYVELLPIFCLLRALAQMCLQLPGAQPQCLLYLVLDDLDVCNSVL